MHRFILFLFTGFLIYGNVKILPIEKCALSFSEWKWDYLKVILYDIILIFSFLIIESTIDFYF